MRMTSGRYRGRRREVEDLRLKIGRRPQGDFGNRAGGRSGSRPQHKSSFTSGYYVDRGRGSTKGSTRGSETLACSGYLAVKEDRGGRPTGRSRHTGMSGAQISRERKHTKFDVEDLKGVDLDDGDGEDVRDGESESELSIEGSASEDSFPRKWDGQVLDGIFKRTVDGDSDVEDIYLAETAERTGRYERMKKGLHVLHKREAPERIQKHGPVLLEERVNNDSDEFGGAFVRFTSSAPTEERKEPEVIVLDEEDGEIEEDPGDERDPRLPPWLNSRASITAHDNMVDVEMLLHYEILDFASFMMATEKERQVREDLVERISSIIGSLWAEAEVRVFGSFATNLYLPTSDIDVCVLNTPEGGSPRELHEVADALRGEKGLVRKIEVIEKAFVPLVKLVDRASDVKCDISFGRNNGPSNVLLIRQYLEDFPSLMPLILVVKCFMHQRMLNEVYRGGIGSYALLLLVVSHLQHYRTNFKHRMGNGRTMPNLGSVLIDFFILYGSKFNYVYSGIRIKNNGNYYSKKRKFITDSAQPMLLSIEDPQDEENEIAKNSFNLRSIRKAFAHAQQQLTMWRHGNSISVTPLSCILPVDSSFHERGDLLRRCRAVQDFPVLNRTLPPLHYGQTSSEGSQPKRSRQEHRRLLAEASSRRSKSRKHRSAGISKKELRRREKKQERRNDRRMAKQRGREL